MRRASFQAMSPAGLVIDAVNTEADRLLVIARPVTLDAACPECGRRSGQVHSRYDRRLMDLPSHAELCTCASGCAGSDAATLAAHG